MGHRVRFLLQYFEIADVEQRGRRTGGQMTLRLIPNALVALLLDCPTAARFALLAAGQSFHCLHRTLSQTCVMSLPCSGGSCPLFARQSTIHVAAWRVPDCSGNGFGSKNAEA